MNGKERRKAVLGLVRKLLVLSVLLASLALLTASEFAPAHALSDWSDCDAAFIDNDVPGCISTYNQCIAGCSNNTQCENSCVSSYQNCLAGANTAHTDCMYSSNPQPLPVIDTRRSDCMAGCQSCYESGYTMEGFVCAVACQNYCAENFPKP